jgi:dipeptidase E
MKESGLAAMLPTLDAVWVGLSAGSVVMAPRIGRNFVHWPEEGADDAALGMVDFAIFPHLGYPTLPEFTLDHAERWAATLATPGYAIDEETAIVVANGEVQVVSEGAWHLFDKP